MDEMEIEWLGEEFFFLLLRVILGREDNVGVGVYRLVIVS